MTDTELLLELYNRLDYNPEKGELRRKAGFTGTLEGKLVGSVDSGGKLQATFLGKRYRVAYLIWFMECGKFPEGVLVYKNMDKLDNRISNLIDCTRSEVSALKFNVMEQKQRKVLRAEERVKNRKPVMTKKERRQKEIEYNLKRKQHRDANKEEALAKERAYRNNNKEMYNKSLRKHYANNKQDPTYKATRACRQLLSRTIAACKLGKTQRTEELMGYGFGVFKQHIEEQFEDWMCWANHGEWHVDHIKPVSAYRREGITDPKIINALANLRPLPARENLSKGSSYR